MKYWIPCFFAAFVSLFNTVSAISRQNPASPPPVPFDADLFRKDVQCFSLHGDFLLWSIQENALDYALTMNQNGWGPNQCYAQGNFENASFDIEPGFRLSGVFFRAPHYWEFWVQYARLTARGNDSSSKPTPDQNFLTGTWPQIFTNPMASAKSSIHLNYNIADGLVTRVFFPNPHLRLRVIGGAVLAWISQFWKVVYADSTGLQTKLVNRWKFTGAGLRIGTSFDWYWFSDIYMTGGSTLAGLIGSYQNKGIQTTNYSPGAGYNTNLPIRDAHFQDTRPVISGQFYLGPSYQKNFPNNRFELFVGYEWTSWLNLQEIFRSTSGTPQQQKETWINTGILALQGLTARASLDF